MTEYILRPDEWEPPLLPSLPEPVLPKKQRKQRKKQRSRSRRFTQTAPGPDPWEAAAHPTMAAYMNRKPPFLHVTLPKGEELKSFIYLLTQDKSRFRDPEGPCGVIQLSETSWCFFGWYRPDSPKPTTDRKERASISEILEAGDAAEMEDDAPYETGEHDYEHENHTGDPGVGEG